MRNTLLILLMLTGLTSLKAQSLRLFQIEDLQDYQQGLEMALEEDKMIFVVVYYQDDDFEKMVRQGELQDDSLLKAYNQTIPMAIPAGSSMSDRLMASFGDREIPVFFYFTKDEFLTLVTTGYRNSDELIADLAKAQSNGKKFEILREKYAEGTLSAREWLELLVIYELNFPFERSEQLALQFLAGLTDEQLLGEEVQVVLLRYGLNLETRYPKFIVDHRESFNDTSYTEFYEAAYSFNFDMAVDNEDSIVLGKITDILIPGSPEPDSLKGKLVFETEKLFAIETNNFSFWENATIERSKELEGDSNRAEFIFKEGFQIADEFNSTSAQTAARNLASKASELDSNFRYVMLEAYMAYLMKDYENATEIVNAANKLSKSGQDEEKAQRLYRMIQAEKQDQEP